jgi:hypothetical protein
MPRLPTAARRAAVGALGSGQRDATVLVGPLTDETKQYC